MPDFVVTLLGTGTPIPSADRFGPSTLVEAGDQKLLIDAGRGATIRLAQLGVPLGHIDALLLTHYHSDHTSGIPDVWLTGWLESHFGTRRSPFRVVGPPGAKELMSNLERAYAADIKIRIADEKLPPAGIAVAVDEFDTDGPVYEKNGVRVIAFEVDHGDVIQPAYGYRIEYGGRAVVLSGDTRGRNPTCRGSWRTTQHRAKPEASLHALDLSSPSIRISCFSPAERFRRRPLPISSQKLGRPMKAPWRSERT